MARGQLEFILGGWCMNDEATVHYTAMIQQLALGVNYLTDIFGKCGYPKIGWQIDPGIENTMKISSVLEIALDTVYEIKICLLKLYLRAITVGRTF